MCKNSTSNNNAVSNSTTFGGELDLDAGRGDVIAFLILIISMSILIMNYAIPLGDIIFSVAFPIYLFFMNEFRFCRNRLISDRWNELIRRDDKTEAAALRKQQHLVFGKYESNPIFPFYMMAYTIAGLLLPLGTIIYDWRSDEARAAVPHVYMLLGQILMEVITNRLIVTSFHHWPRLLNPIGFSIWREFQLYHWVIVALDHYNQVTYAAVSSSTEYQLAMWGLALASLNAIMWTSNLFLFLIMRAAPDYLDKSSCPDPEVKWIGFVIPTSSIRARGKASTGEVQATKAKIN